MSVEQGTVFDTEKDCSTTGGLCPGCRKGHIVYCFLDPDFRWRIPELTVPDVRPRVVLEVRA